MLVLVTGCAEPQKRQVKPVFVSACDMAAITFRKRMLILVAILSECCGKGVACHMARSSCRCGAFGLVHCVFVVFLCGGTPLFRSDGITPPLGGCKRWQLCCCFLLFVDGADVIPMFLLERVAERSEHG